MQGVKKKKKRKINFRNSTNSFYLGYGYQVPTMDPGLGREIEGDLQLVAGLKSWSLTRHRIKRWVVSP